ncbi:MAG TPA: branched-chain amino acid ABC transporter permease [Acidimicrobiia bacterium]|nr:branched-chain amino acid ABC transporter permease [Acidimicrobiia bacterium]
MEFVRGLSPTARLKLLLLAGAIGVGIALPYLVSPFLVGLATLALIGGLFSMSIDLLGGYGGLITLGQAGVSAAAGYGVGYMANRVGAGYATQILTGLAVGLLVSAIFGVMAMRSDSVYFIMITLAQGMIVWGLSIRLNRITGAENGLTGISRPAGLTLYWQYYWFALGVVALCSLLLYVLVRSPFGSATRGIRESESRMRMLGYNTSLQKFYLFMVAGFFATIAGILLVYLNQFISPSSAHLTTSAIGVLQAILGGMGTLVGPLIGSFVIVFIRNVVSQYLERWPTLLGLTFIVVILFARRGIVGALSRGWRTWLLRRYGEEVTRADRHPELEADVALGAKTSGPS